LVRADGAIHPHPAQERITMIPFQVDPGWYDRYWYSDQPHNPGWFRPGRAFRFLIRRAQAIYAGPQVRDFELWHSPLGPDRIRN
jgi:hypothetical protein